MLCLETEVALLVAALLLTGCQPTCEDRCSAVQSRCFEGETNADICADQCTLSACVDCFRCLDEESACSTDPRCEQRCQGCSRMAPPY